MTDAPRAADMLARRLAQAGCSHVFGMPGGEVLTLLDALRLAGLTPVLTRHENAAGFMAEGAHHRTGAPGVMLATLGPGALNGVNAVANAHQDRVPLIVLTGCVDDDEALSYTHQVLDHRAVFAPITKASFRLTVEGADTIADKAVAIATEGRPGPVHIDVPISVAAGRVTGRLPTRRRAAASPVVPAPAVLTGLRARLAAAARPVMVVGLDAMTERAGPEIRALAERIGMPVITTYKAKGLLPEDHPMALGGAGLSPRADLHLLPLVRASDLILCAGYDPIEMRPGWREVWDPATTAVIDITAEPNHHYMHQATVAVTGHSAATLAALADGLPERKTWTGDDVAACKAALARAFPADEDWGPAAIIDTCRTNLPATTVATVDSGAHRILLSQMWHTPAPRHLLQSSALCTMGCAVPLAMGVSVASPDVPSVAFSGDAGFLMVAGELSTAAELGLRTIFVVFVDASLALIEKKQRERQLPNAAVDFARHDLAAVGRAFGGHGVTVRNRDQLRVALRDALETDRFTVIAAEIDRAAYDGRF